MALISAIILTKNEEKHIARCIHSLKNFCTEIWVIDSFSTDKTLAIAEKLGAKIIKHSFKNQAQQFNWAIRNCNISGEWIWRVDADEYISDDLGQKVCEAIKTCKEDVNGIYVNKAIIFQGRKLKYGGWYPAPQIKIIRKGFGESENKVMDEHLIINSGQTIYVNGDQTDENLNDLTWWSDKHNKYASREAINMLMMQYEMDAGAEEVTANFFGNDDERKRWLKIRYARMPLFLRPFIYFFVRYILKLGFLDGKQGFIWHVLQGFWYRFLVDAKVYEIKKNFSFNDENIKQYITEKYLIKANQGGVNFNIYITITNTPFQLEGRRTYAA